MGRTLAWQLLLDSKSQGKHLTITLFDKDPIDSGSAAAYTAAGMLTPYCELESAEELVFKMGMHALKLWPKLVESLDDDIDFHQNGSIVVAHRNDRADYQRFLNQLNSKLDLVENKDFKYLDQDLLNRNNEGLGETFSQGIFFPDEAWLDTHKYMKVIAKKLNTNENGILKKESYGTVNWHYDEQIKTIQNIDHNTRLTSDKGVYHFNQVIDCRGLEAKQEIPDLRGVRGEVITLYAPEVNINRLVRLMHPRYKLYLVPRRNNIYLLGATQIESEDRSEITVRSALELLSAVYSLHPGFAEARVIHTDTNCRPALKDNLPRIESEQNLIRINGLFRHGYLLAPVIAQEASKKILNLKTPILFPQLFKYEAS